MKNICITGASRGIGRALVEKFLEEGHRVFAISRSGKKLEELQEKYGVSNLQIAELEFTKIENLTNSLQNIYPWEQLDILYNNAGFLVNKPFDNLEIKDFRQSLDVNFVAPILLIQSLVKKMNNEGQIVNIGTMGAVQGSAKFGGLAAYSSSKAALANLTELLAEEWSGEEDKPNINYIALGAVQTEMLTAAFPGYQASIQPKEMAEYLYDFGMKGAKFYNGKILQTSNSTP